MKYEWHTVNLILVETPGAIPPAEIRPDLSKIPGAKHLRRAADDGVEIFGLVEIEE